jgi:hypothetical protein
VAVRFRSCGTSMKIQGAAVLLLGLAGALLVGYSLQTTRTTPPPLTAPEPRALDPAPMTQMAAVSRSTETASVAAGDSLNLGPHRVARSTSGYLRRDHYTYVLQIIDHARAGDPESMFEVWQALRLCERHERQFRGHTLLEAIRELPMPHEYQIRKATEIYAACGRFYAEGFHEFTDTVDFKTDAARAGHPPAVIDQALGQLASGAELADAELRSRVLAALNSGHPQALVLARHLGLINVVDQTTARAFAISGCQLGYDCARQGPLMKEICWTTPLCGESDSFVSFLERSLSASEFRSTMETASQIRDEVSNGVFDATRLSWDTLDIRRFHANPQQKSAASNP